MLNAIGGFMKQEGQPGLGGGDFTGAISYAQMKADHRQHLLNIELDRNERIQNRGVDEVKVDQHLASLRNLGKGRTIEEVDKILGNTDVAGTPELLAAYKLWEYERAQDVAQALPDGVADLDKRREDQAA